MLPFLITNNCVPVENGEGGVYIIIRLGTGAQHIYCHPTTEDCKLVVTCKMQNRNATDKLNPQYKHCLLTNLWWITMLVYYIVDLAYQLHFYFAFCK